MKKIIVLGVTGSIGQSTIEIAREFPNDIKIVALQAHRNDKLLSELGREFNINNLALTGNDKSSFNNIKYFTMDGLVELLNTTKADLVINGIAGSSGLMPSVISIKNKMDLALANKETMVMAGSLINNLAKENGVKLLPVDSEHSAIFHLLENDRIENISEIILTASGGAFRDWPIEKLETVTPSDALKHPTWNMGNKITIDSASMANKGLEVIEAARLFNVKKNHIKVLIHPQSYVHSLVRKNDNSLYAQISAPNMKLPIQNAIFYPNIKKVESCYLDLTDKQMNFYKPDLKKYKMLDLAYLALEKGETYTIAYNAVNEVLVDYFVNSKISFLDIPKYTELILNMDLCYSTNTIEDIINLDKNVREIIKKKMENII